MTLILLILLWYHISKILKKFEHIFSKKLLFREVAQAYILHFPILNFPIFHLNCWTSLTIFMKNLPFDEWQTISNDESYMLLFFFSALRCFIDKALYKHGILFIDEWFWTNVAFSRRRVKYLLQLCQICMLWKLKCYTSS